MKKITAAIFFVPVFAFTQETNNNLGISGGLEFQNSKTLAWNVQTSFNRRFAKSDRWSAEYGAGLCVLEHRRDFNVPVSYDTSLAFPTYGPLIYPGYLQNDYIYYSKTIGLRFQAGVNYILLKKNKFIFSAGLNVVNAILLDYKEHGQRTFRPVAGYAYDTLQYWDYHYSDHQKTSTTNNAVSLQLQPHIDCFIPISQKLIFTARLGYYIQMVSGIRFIRPQSNLGIAYRW